MANPEYSGTIVQLANIYIATLINASCFLSSPHQVEPYLLEGPRGQLHFIAGVWMTTFRTKRSERRTWALLCHYGIYPLSTILRMRRFKRVVHRLGDRKPNIAVKRMGKVYYEPLDSECHG